MGRKKTEVMKLECILNDKELKDYSKELSKELTDKSRAEDDKKAFNSQMKARIDGHDARISALSEKIGSEKEYRDIECEVVYDWKAKTRSYLREDTGEIAFTDIIPERELQEEMELESEEAVKDRENTEDSQENTEDDTDVDIEDEPKKEDEGEEIF